MNSRVLISAQRTSGSPPAGPRPPRGAPGPPGARPGRAGATAWRGTAPRPPSRRDVFAASELARAGRPVIFVEQRRVGHAGRASAAAPARFGRSQSQAEVRAGPAEDAEDAGEVGRRTRFVATSIARPPGGASAPKSSSTPSAALSTSTHDLGHQRPRLGAGDSCSVVERFVVVRRRRTAGRSRELQDRPLQPADVVAVLRRSRPPGRRAAARSRAGWRREKSSTGSTSPTPK